MTDDPAEREFLTEPEVARILRCGTSKVKRLRLGGRLAYLPGRPVLIARADLNAFIEETMRKARKPEAAAASDDTRTRGEADARQWALNAVFKYRAPRRIKK